VKRAIKNIAHRFGIEVSKYKSDIHETGLVSLKPDDRSIGNVLLAYVIDPFLLKDNERIPSSHTHFWESIQIAETFLDFGYSVDVISYRNRKFIPKREYTIFVSARTNFERITKSLNKDCVGIVHLDTSHWLFNNYASYSRCIALQHRRGASLTSFKLVEPNRAIECADFATMLGNSFTIGTYSFANKKILPVPVPACTTYQWTEDKDYEFCRSRFIWLGSHGLVHKGLDLTLEAFAEMPDYHLTVCGPVKADKDFERTYYKELYETPNIHTVGWIDIERPEFMDVIRNSIGLVYPSCAEGQSGAVITCLQAGLIPIISQESGVDVSDFGLILRNCSIDEIKGSVRKVSALSAEELAMKARQSWEYARKYHTRENFSKEYKGAIKRIIGI